MKNIKLYFRWMGRLSAILLFLFWGAFFWEHLMEWFFNEKGVLPPAKVWIGQFLHLLMILSLAVMTVQHLWGCILTVVSTAAFFGWIGYKGFPFIALLNLIPVFCFFIYWILSREIKEKQDTGLKNQN